MSQYKASSGDEERHPLNLYRDEAPAGESKKKMFIIGGVGILVLILLIIAILFGLWMIEKEVAGGDPEKVT